MNNAYPQQLEIPSACVEIMQNKGYTYEQKKGCWVRHRSLYNGFIYVDVIHVLQWFHAGVLTDALLEVILLDLSGAK